MAISYSVVNALKEKCKDMSVNEINKKIEHYKQFLDSLNIGDQTKLAVINYANYICVSEDLRVEYENLIDSLKSISKTKDYIDSMYHLERAGRIIGATEKIMAETKQKKDHAESQIRVLTKRKKYLEEQEPNLLLKENMLSLDAISDDVLTSIYFENLIKIKVLNDELHGRLEHFGEQQK